MAIWQSILLGVLLGVVLGIVWSDTVSIIRIAYKTKHGTPVREALISDAQEAFASTIPRWLIFIVGVTCVAQILIGAASVWQYSKFSDYQACVESRDKVQSNAQDLRTADLLQKERAFRDWLSSIPPALSGHATAAQVEALRKQSRTVRNAQNDYLQTVQENPYPKPVQEICGSVSRRD